MHPPTGPRPYRVAALLSCSSFEDFFTDSLGISRDDYLQRYRNDWSWEYARHLRDVGVELIICVPTYGEPLQTRTHDGFDVRFIPHRRAMRIYRHLPLLSRTPVGRWVFEALGALSILQSLSRRMHEDHVDVLYVQEYWTGRFDVLAVLLRLPLVAADHGGSAHRQVALLKRWTLRRARRITTQTAGEDAEVRRRGGASSLLPNAVDTDFFHPSPVADGPALEAPRLLHVARLVDHHKRTSDLLRALPRLPSSWVLDVVGTGPDEGRLRQLCEDLGVSHRVAFHGFVTERDQLRDRYRSAAVLVQPSAHEARLLAAMEAMACGTPVVLSDIPVFRDMVGDGRGGSVVDATDPSALSAAISAAVDAGQPLRDAARQRAVEEFAWTTTAQAFRSILDGVVEAP